MIEMKKISIINLIIMVMIMIGTTSYAKTMDDIISSGDTFIGIGANETSPINETTLKNTSNDIYNILFSIAVVIAIAAGMIIGIQFVTGSVEEQAKVKETLIPYIIGVIVIFGAFGIWRIVVDVGQSIF